MPQWLYIAFLVVLAVVISPAISAATLVAAAKICRAPRVGRHSMGLVVAVVYVQLPSSMALLGVESKPANVLAGVLSLGALLGIARYVLGARWGRSVLIVLTNAVLVLIVSVPLALALKHTVADGYRVPTGGMSPAINPGDHVFADRTLAPRRWDIVIYRRPWEKDVVNVGRLVGLPGDTVEIVPPGVKINGQPVPLGPDMATVSYACRQYRSQPSQSSWICNGCGTPITLGPDEYFFLGDNAAASLDSRYWEATATHQAGALPRDRIVGVVRARYAPINRLHVFR